MRRILLFLISILLLSSTAYATDKGIYTRVGVGTVTQANMKISAVDGTAFIDFTSAGVLTSKIGHLLRVKDSSGNVIQGFIKAAGTGETLGSELITNGNMESGDPPSGWSLQRLTGARSADAHGGSYAHQLTISSTTNGYWYQTVAPPVLSLAKVSAFLKNGTSTSMSLMMNSAGDTANKLFGSVTATSYTEIGGYWTGQNRSIAIPNMIIIGYINDAVGKIGLVDDVSVKQVLTPSATGVTITSTKGGTTYNWANKSSSFNYNDASGYTYEIVKVNNPISIAGGAVTAANEHVSLVDGTAFYFGSIDCTNYQDGRHYILMKDASGYAAFAKIKAEAPAGETLGSEVLVNAGFASDTAGWLFGRGSGASVAGGESGNCLQLTSNGIAGGVYAYQQLNITVGGLYKGLFYGKSGTGGDKGIVLYYQLSANGFKAITSSGSWALSPALYTTVPVATDNLYIISSVATNGQTALVDTVSFKKVLTPPSTGAILVNAAGTQNFIYKHASFNANTIANIQILYMGD